MTDYSSTDSKDAKPDGPGYPLSLPTRMCPRSNKRRLGAASFDCWTSRHEASVLILDRIWIVSGIQSALHARIVCSRIGKRAYTQESAIGHMFAFGLCSGCTRIFDIHVLLFHLFLVTIPKSLSQPRKNLHQRNPKAEADKSNHSHPTCLYPPQQPRS